MLGNEEVLALLYGLRTACAPDHLLNVTPVQLAIRVVDDNEGVFSKLGVVASSILGIKKENTFVDFAASAFD